MDKIVKVPRFLYEIHGKNPTALDLWLTYAAGIIGGVVGVVLAQTSGIDLWKALLVGLLFFDIAGGVVANFTVSTRMYYGGSRRRRILFLCLHVLQPLLMALILGDYLLLMIFTATFAVAGGLIINLLKTIKSRRVLAIALTAIGVLALSVAILSVPVFVYAFSVLFLIKILLAFSVNRYTRNET